MVRFWNLIEPAVFFSLQTESRCDTWLIPEDLSKLEALSSMKGQFSYMQFINARNAVSFSSKYQILH